LSCIPEGLAPYKDLSVKNPSQGYVTAFSCRYQGFVENPWLASTCANLALRLRKTKGVTRFIAPRGALMWFSLT